MHANATNLLALVVLATSLAPAFAAPVLQTEKRAVTAVLEGAARGIGEGAIETAFDDLQDKLKRSDLQQRATGAILGDLAKGAGEGALETGAEDLKNDLGLRRRHILVEGNLPSNHIFGVDKKRRSAGAVVDGLVEGIGKGAVEAGFDDLKDDLGLRRRNLENIPLPHLQVIPYASDLKQRSVGAVVDGLVEGVGEGALKTGFDDLKSDLGLRDFSPAASHGPEIDSGLYSRALEGIIGSIIWPDVDIQNDKRSVGALVNGALRGAGEAVAETGFDDLKSDLVRDCFRDLSALKGFQSIGPETLLEYNNARAFGPILGDVWPGIEGNKRAVAALNGHLIPLPESIKSVSERSAVDGLD